MSDAANRIRDALKAGLAGLDEDNRGEWLLGNEIRDGEAALDELLAENERLRLERDLATEDMRDAENAANAAEARCARLEAALREADTALANYEQESTHGLTASAAFMDRCVRVAREALAADLAEEPPR